MMDINIYEIIGYIGVIFSIISFSSHKTKNIRAYGILAITFFMISVYGNGGMNGAFVSLVSLVVKILAYFVEETKLRSLKIITPFIAVFFYLVINEEGIIGILPAIALVITAFADLQREPIRMKEIYVLALIPWLIYAINLESTSAILYEALGIVILLYTIYVLKNKKTKKGIEK